MARPAAFDEPGRDWQGRIAALPPARAAVLAQRAATAPLYAHAYAFHLNFRLGPMLPGDLLDFAQEHRLAGVKIHVEDGEERSLSAISVAAQRAFGARAAAMGLDLHIETSSTSPAALAQAVAICHATGASSMRCYPRYEGRVSQIVARCIDDLRQLDRLDPGRRLRVTLEQHEDLTSDELLRILAAVGSDRLSLLFDFGNMINALETPLAALARQSAHVTEVHVKDCLVVPDRGGWGHLACLSGQGDIPMPALLTELLLLGEQAPQVRAFALEEEEAYFAPALRFPGEGPDPVIPARGASETDPGPGDLAARLAQERAAAWGQVATVRAMLAGIGRAALARARQS